MQAFDQVLGLLDQDNISRTGIRLRAFLHRVNVTSVFLMTALHALDRQDVAVHVFGLQGRELTNSQTGHEAEPDANVQWVCAVGNGLF